MHLMCPLDRHPSNEPLALYEKCWGPEWQAVRTKLTRAHLFTPLQVMMSLISAFLHTRLLDRETLRRDIQNSVLDITGVHGQVLKAFVSDKARADHLDHVINLVNAKIALDLLEEDETDDSTVQTTLKADAAKHASDRVIELASETFCSQPLSLWSLLTERTELSHAATDLSQSYAAIENVREDRPNLYGCSYDLDFVVGDMSAKGLCGARNGSRIECHVCDSY